MLLLSGAESGKLKGKQDFINNSNIDWMLQGGREEKLAAEVTPEEYHAVAGKSLSSGYFALINIVSHWKIGSSIVQMSVVSKGRCAGTYNVGIYLQEPSHVESQGLLRSG